MISTWYSRKSLFAKKHGPHQTRHSDKIRLRKDHPRLKRRVEKDQFLWSRRKIVVVGRVKILYHCVLQSPGYQIVVWWTLAYACPFTVICPVLPTITSWFVLCPLQMTGQLKEPNYVRLHQFLQWYKRA